MALRAGARKILKKSSLFLLIRTSGRHLWECKSFCGDKRDTSLWTEPKERVCCLHFSTPRPTQQRPSPGPQLLDASCLPENRDRSQCVHAVHCFSECIPENCYHEKNSTKLLRSFVKVVYLRVTIQSGDLTSYQTQQCPGITQTQLGTSFLSKYL